MDSNVFPFVSGTIFQTNNADKTLITPYKQYVKEILNASNEGNVADTIKLEIHCAATAIAIALLRMVFGNISEINTQQIGPHDIIKEAE